MRLVSVLVAFVLVFSAGIMMIFEVGAFMSEWRTIGFEALVIPLLLTLAFFVLHWALRVRGIGESVAAPRRFRLTGDVLSVRGWLVTSIVTAVLTALLTLPWIFALMTHYVMILGSWVLPGTLVAAIGLVAVVGNNTLYRRGVSPLSLRGAWISWVSLLVIGVQWLVVALWSWSGGC